jgi:hypothetical protein
MNEKKPETYSIGIVLSRYVGGDGGFFAICEFKEVRTGIENIKESLSVGVEDIKGFIKRAFGEIEDDVFNQEG